VVEDGESRKKKASAARYHRGLSALNAGIGIHRSTDASCILFHWANACEQCQAPAAHEFARNPLKTIGKYRGTKFADHFEHNHLTGSTKIRAAVPGL
jgi:hypothetical protein